MGFLVLVYSLWFRSESSWNLGMYKPRCGMHGSVQQLCLKMCSKTRKK